MLPVWGPLDVTRKWMRKANPAKFPIDDPEDYFRVVFNKFFSNLKAIFGAGCLRWYSRMFRVSSYRHRSIQYGRGNGCRKRRIVLSNIAGLSFELYVAYPYATVVVRSVGILIISLQLIKGNSRRY